jgi:hypothetical protein
MTTKQLAGLFAPDGSQYITLTDGNGNLVTTGGGSGTVTSVSVTTTNGISGTVATPTTTPAISLTLGAITPTSATIGAGSAITSSGPGGALASGAYTSAYTLPAATSSTLGGVKPDGTTITNTSGAISVTYGTSSNTAVQGGGALGTPLSGTLTNVSGLPISTGISGLGSGVATALGNTAGGTGGFALQSGLTSYLPLAGGTMTGTITASDASTYGSSGISGTTINNSIIGGSTAAAGTFTAAAASSLAMSGNITFSSTNAVTTSGTAAISLTTSTQAGANNAAIISIKAGNNNQASGSNNGGNVSIGAGNASGAGSTGNGGNITLTPGTSIGGTRGDVIIATTLQLHGYTVATLPAGNVGDTAYVTDALSPTFLVAVTGGGAVVTPVFYNGSAWVGG